MMLLLGAPGFTLEVVGEALGSAMRGFCIANHDLAIIILGFPAILRWAGFFPGLVVVVLQVTAGQWDWQSAR